MMLKQSLRYHNLLLLPVLWWSAFNYVDKTLCVCTVSFPETSFMLKLWSTFDGTKVVSSHAKEIYHWLAFYNIGILDGNRYYLCLLLNCVIGSHLEKHFKNAHGVVYPTWLASAEKLGLLILDGHHWQTLAEASTWATVSQWQELFSIIWVHSCPVNPWSL